MKETTASAKPLARPIGWRSVPALTAELQSRGPLLAPPPGDVRRSAWHVPPRRPQCGPYPVDTLGRPIGAGAPTRGESRSLPLPVLRHAVLAGVGLVLIHHGHAVQPSDLLRATSRRSIDDIKPRLGRGTPQGPMSQRRPAGAARIPAFLG